MRRASFRPATRPILRRAATDARRRSRAFRSLEVTHGAHMGSMGWWMVLWWVAGIVVLVLLVPLVAGAAGGFSPGGGETPEQILKRRYGKGEIERDEYQRCLEDLRR